MAGTYKGTLEALLATVIDGEQGALNVNVVAQGAQPTPMGAYKGTPEALLATVVDGEMGAINVNVLSGGGGIKVLPVAWSPAHVGSNETDSGVIVLPAPCLLLGAYWRRVTPTDAGSTPTLRIADDQGVFDSGAFNLKSDDLSIFATEQADQSFFVWAIAVSASGSGGISVYVPLSFTFTYVAGLTPGATKPVFELAFVCVPIT